MLKADHSLKNCVESEISAQLITAAECDQQVLRVQDQCSDVAEQSRQLTWPSGFTGTAPPKKVLWPSYCAILRYKVEYVSPVCASLVGCMKLSEAFGQMDCKTEPEGKSIPVTAVFTLEK